MLVRSLCVGAGVLAGGALTWYLRRKPIGQETSTKPARKPAALRVRGGGASAPLGVSRCESFPWGKEAFSMPLMPVCMAMGAAAVAAVISLTTPTGPIISLHMARGPVLVTLTWVIGYFNAIGAQLMIKFGGGNEQATKVTERSLYNTIEQGLPFLSLLWMMAACVDAGLATSCGAVYVAFRMFYPLAYSYYGGFSMLCELITQPNYIVINFFIANLTCFGVGGSSLLAYTGSNFFVWLVLNFAGAAFCFKTIWSYPVGSLSAKYNLSYNKAD